MSNNVNVINSIKTAISYSEELKMLVLSLCEDVKNSPSTAEAWTKIQRFYDDAEAMKSFQNGISEKTLAFKEIV